MESKRPSMHVSEITVRGYECDFYRHVNNAVYINYLEHARSEYLRERGFDLFELRDVQKVMLVVVRNEINYRLPAAKNDVLEIHSTISKLGGGSCTFRQEIVRKEGGLLIADALVTWASVNLETGKATRIPESLREMLVRELG